MRVSAVAAGGGHSLALSEDKVYSFGIGVDGQLGHGDEESAYTPRVIASLRGVRAIAAGSATSLAVDSAGAVFGWGRAAALGLQPAAVQAQLSPRRFPSLVAERV